jgi:hypothetical protein
MGMASQPDDQSERLERCEICGGENIGVYGPFEGLGTNAECFGCGAQYWTKSGWIDSEEL